MNMLMVPWRGADTYRGLALAVSGVLAMLLIWLFLTSRGIVREGALSLAPLFALEGVLFAVAWRFSIWRHRVGWAALGLRRTLTRAHVGLLLLVLAASLLLTGLYAALLIYVGLGASLPAGVPEEIREMRGALRISSVVLIVLWAPLSEELFFRGFLLQGVAAGMGPWVAAVVSALLFSVSHGSPVLLVPVFVSGLLLAWLFFRTRSLNACITAHALQNALAFAVAT
jgi:membrane protease YdiL (CAAX protease family)